MPDTIRLTGDASDLVNAAQQAAAAMQALSTALARTGRAADGADDKIEQVGKKSKRAGADVDRMEAAMGKASRGAELFGLTAETLVTKIFEFGAALADTIRNIEEIEKAMSASARGAFREQIDAVKEAKAEVDKMDESWTKLKVTLAGTDGAVASATFAAGAMEILTASVRENGVALTVWNLLGQSTNLTFAVQKLRAEEAAEAFRLASKAAAESLAEMDQLAMAAALGLPTANVPAADKPQGGGRKGPSAADLADERAIREAMASAARLDRLRDEAQQRIDIDKFADDEIQRIADERAIREAMASAARLDREKEEKLAVFDDDKKKMQDRAALASEIFGSVTTTISEMGKVVVQGIKSGGKESKKAMRDAAIAAKAFAIFDITVKGLQGIMASASLGYPMGIPGIIASSAIHTASTVAVLATPLPKLHTGGRRGAEGADERITPAAVVRAGEVPTVLTEQGFTALGGDRGLAALNRGQAGGGGMPPVYLVLEGVTARLGELARPEPGLGQS